MTRRPTRTITHSVLGAALAFLGAWMCMALWGSARADTIKPGWETFMPLAPPIGWLLLAIMVVLALWSNLLRTARQVLKRIEDGAAVEIGWFKVGVPTVPDQAEVSALLLDPQRTIAGNLKVQTPDEDMKRRWDEFGWEAGGVMLVHRYRPSTVPGQIYDVDLYLVERQRRALRRVDRVEYYFGPRWEGIFAVNDSQDNLDFRIRISAYDRFICVARIHFVGRDRPATICRYVDFEFGRLRTLPTNPLEPLYPETRERLAELGA